MNLTLARAAIRAFPRTPWSNRRALNAHRRRYIAARESLGDRWLLANLFNGDRNDRLA